MRTALDCYQAARANNVEQPHSANGAQMGVNPEYNAPQQGSTTYQFTTREGSEAYRAQAQANYSPTPPSHADGTPQPRFDQQISFPTSIVTLGLSSSWYMRLGSQPTVS